MVGMNSRTLEAASFHFVSRDCLYSVGPIRGTVLEQFQRGRISMWNRIESLYLIFCGLGLLLVVMFPGTEKFLGRVFPWWFNTFLTSLFEGLVISLILFGILGIIAPHGVNLMQRHLIEFIVIWGIGTALFLRWNSKPREFRTNLY